MLVPVVLGAVYLGGWWVFALVAIAGGVALHEYWLMARRSRRSRRRGTSARRSRSSAPSSAGVTWMLAGVLSTFALAFLLKAISEARPAGNVGGQRTVMGTLWIGGGLSFFLLLRDLPQHGRLALVTVLIAVWAGDTFAYFGGRLVGRHKMAPDDVARGRRGRASSSARPRPSSSRSSLSTSRTS